MRPMYRRYEIENALLGRKAELAHRLIEEWKDAPVQYNAHGLVLESVAALAATLGYWSIAQSALQRVPISKRGAAWLACFDYAEHMRADVEQKLTHPWYIHHKEWSFSHLFEEDQERVYAFRIDALKPGEDVELYMRACGDETRFYEASMTWEEFVDALGTEPTRAGQGDYGELRDTEIRLFERRPFAPEALPPLNVDLLRLKRREGEVQGDTFVEKLVRGEVSEEEVDDYIDLWHEQDDPLTQVRLADYLGLMPSEYVEMITYRRHRNLSDFWRAVVADRTERWNKGD